MCGIVGIYSKIGLTEKEITHFKNMLIRCETRGRDATGMFNDDMEFVKFHLDATEFVKKKISRDFLKSCIGKKYVIGHCRRATRGNPENNENNHPFFSDEQDVFMVHNGHAKCEKFDMNKDRTDSFVYINAIKHFRNLEECKNLKMNEIIEKAYIECEKEVWCNASVAVFGTRDEIVVCKSYTSPLIMVWNTDKTKMAFASTKSIIGEMGNLASSEMEAETMITVKVENATETKKKLIIPSTYPVYNTYGGSQWFYGDCRTWWED